MLIPINWSPNGRWIVYREVDIRGPDPGSDILLNPTSGQTCRLAEAPGMVMQMHYHDQWEWQADGRLLVIEQGGVEIREPCQPSGESITERFPAAPVEITAASADRRLFVVKTGAGDAIYDGQSGAVRTVQPEASGVVARGISWAPDGRHYAVIGYPDWEHANAGTVRIVEASSGRLIAHRNVQLWGIDDSFPPPIWLDNDRILVGRTIDLGPFVMALDGRVTALIPGLVNMPVNNDGDCAPFCLGILVLAGGSAGSPHILFNPVQADNRLVLYHFETHTFERVPPGGYRFSPGGRWLWALQAYEKLPKGLWLRPVDPSGSAAVPIDVGGEIPPPEQPLAVFDWSADSRMMATALVSPPHTIKVISAPEGREAARWSLGDYAAASGWSADWAWIGDGVWSPDSQSLLLRGDLPDEAGYALFLLTTP